MSNMNNIENEKMLAFADDYAELCRNHGVYLVFNDDVWLQYAGNAQDLAEVAPNLIEALTNAQLPKIEGE
jgi:exosome complex RNA-binding protein Rrp42 (RNase PH superfamily)